MGTEPTPTDPSPRGQQASPTVGPDEHALTEELANLGELSRPLTHLFNNFLNSLVLKVAVLDQQLPESYRPSLAQLRQQATAVAEHVKRYQQYRQQIEPTGARADVNRAVREAVEMVRAIRGEPGGDSFEATLALGDDLPPAVGTTSELRRCCFFLIANARRASRMGAVVVRTQQSAGNVQIQIEDEGPSVDPAQLAKLFELGGPARPDTQPLELAASRSISRRLGGRLRAENKPAGGFTVILDIPTAAK